MGLGGDSLPERGAVCLPVSGAAEKIAGRGPRQFLAAGVSAGAVLDVRRRYGGADADAVGV